MTKHVARTLNIFAEAFLFNSLSRYGIKGSKYLESNKKYYLSDLSFTKSILGNRFVDIGHLYENLIAIELLRRGYGVYIGKIYDKKSILL